MKALVYTAPQALDYRDVPDPVPDSAEVLLRVESVGICGSDMHAFLGHDDRRPAPLILGHEVAGTIIAGPRAGLRVTVNPLVTCGQCAACLAGRDNLCPKRQIISMAPRAGGFAEQLAIPEANLVAVPDAVSFDQAALTEPVACGWHAARLGLAALGGSDTRALVFGGGAIGVGAALSLAAQGVNDITIVEPNAMRRQYLGQTCDLHIMAPDQLDPKYPYDLIIDGVGFRATRAQASAMVRPGGVIMHIGLGDANDGLDIRRMTLQEIAFIGTYTYTAQDFRDTAQAIFDGRLGALDWTEARPLSDGQRAFTDIQAGRVQAPKIILKPS